MEDDENKTVERPYIDNFLEPSGKNITNSKIFYALERAWKNRDFEIEHYWKRATYFWTFIAATFLGYFTVLTKVDHKSSEYDLVLFVLVCLGLVFSVGWVLVNLGSKKWQENWEAHIDLLEDNVTGPLYKTVKQDEVKSYSVSKVNLLVSKFVLSIWLILYSYSAYTAFKDFSDVSNICEYLSTPIKIVMIVTTILTIVIISLMYGKAGQTRNSNQRRPYRMVTRGNNVT